MVSKTAQADIEDMWDKGLKPTVADIIRLNALGIKLERSMKPDTSIFNLRRCAFLGEDAARICFMQPTIAHDIWHDVTDVVVDFNDTETSLAIDAYICATPYDKLPDPTDQNAVKDSVNVFLKRLYPFTSNQIAAVVLYCKYGIDWMIGEYPPPNPNAESNEIDEFDSISLGIMLGGIATGIGLTMTEAKGLTKSQFMSMLIKRARYEGSIDKKKLKSDAEDDYLRALDEITDRLNKHNEDMK